MSASRKRLEKQLIDLRLASKQMQAESRRATKRKVEGKRKCKAAIERGMPDMARIYAENAIRAEKESLSMLRLSSRVDAVASRVQTAINMNMVTSSIARIVHIMAGLTSQKAVWKSAQMMDRFEQQFHDLDVQMAMVEQSVDSTVATSTPGDQVNELIAQVADAHQLELAGVLDADELAVARASPRVASSSSASAQTQERQAVAQDAEALSVMDRLASLNPSRVAPRDDQRK
jgi:charged multivesicular body protein 1